MFDFKKLFRKSNFLKEEKLGLEKARALNLITEEEFLRLKESRATEDLEKFLENKKLRK